MRKLAIPTLLLVALAAAALAGGFDQALVAIQARFGGPVDGRGATDGQVLTWSGGRWAPGDAAGAGVSVSGSGLSGDGSAGDPLTLAAFLRTLIDGGGTATAGAGTVLDLSTTGGLLSGNGSAAAPSMAFSADPGTGFFRGGASYAALALGGTERFGFLTAGGASVFNAMSPFRIAVNGNTVLSYNESDPGVDLGTGVALAFGTGANDPRLVKTATDELSARDGSGNYGLICAGGMAFGNGSSGTLAGQLNKLIGYDHVGNVTWQVDTLGNHETVAADWKVRWSNSNTSIGTLDTALSRDAAGRVLVENGSGTQADLRLATLYFGNSPGSTTARLSNSGTTLIAARGDGASGANGALLRITGDGSASGCALQIGNDINTGLFGIADSFVGTAVNSRTVRIEGARVNLTDATYTTVMTIPLANGAAASGQLTGRFYGSDGTNVQSQAFIYQFSAVRTSGGTLNSSASAAGTTDPFAETSGSSTMGSLGIQITDSGGTAILVQLRVDTSLTPTTLVAEFNADVFGASAQAVAIP